MQVTGKITTDNLMTLEAYSKYRKENKPAIMAHRRLLWFSLPDQALQVLPLFVLAHAVEWVLSAIIGGTFPGAWVLLAPLLEAALWPLISWLLLAPQRRAPDPDENRPL